MGWRLDDALTSCLQINNGLVWTVNGVQACDDKQQIEPMLKKFDALPDALINHLPATLPFD